MTVEDSLNCLGGARAVLDGVGQVSGPNLVVVSEPV